MNEKLFDICVEEYDARHRFNVCWPASLDAPKDNAVMFLMEKAKGKMNALLEVEHCLVFWQEGIDVPDEILTRHAISVVKEPRLEYCRFFKTNQIRNLPRPEPFRIVEGAYICLGATIPDGCIIMPGAYIGGQVKLGANNYIGCGAKLIGRISTGDNVIIRENTVIGADGLSTDRDVDGAAISMPQFGGIQIGDHVEIGPNTVIERGAIDDTIIQQGCKLDDSISIGHNVFLGRDTFIVGGTTVLGSAKTEARAFISGNSIIRTGIIIGEDATVGMGAVVTKNVPAGATVIGNPARIK